MKLWSYLSYIVNMSVVFGLQVEKLCLQVYLSDLEHSVPQFRVKLGSVQSQKM